jgi:polyhydroxybutyrate depolymerase
VRLLLATILLFALDARAAMREFTIRVGDAERSWLLHVPAKKSAGKWPLVVLLHGGGGNGRQAARSYGMNEVADRNGFLVAYPNGSGRRENILLTWNSGNCCGYAMHRDIDDVAFIRAMIERIDRDFGIDRTRVYATGMSNGGMMAHRLGCQAADLFAAIAPVAGALNIRCKPADRVAVMIVHGTADEHVPYDGGTGAKALEPRVDEPVSHAVDVWRTANGCARRSTSAIWTGCHDGADVALVTIEGGGHEWPENGSERIWKFFAAHPKR